MRYVRYCLDVLTKPTPCAVPWDLMEGTECARTCPMCDKQVFDVAEMDPLYADDFLREHMPKPPRLTLRRRPDGRVLEEECKAGARQRIMSRLRAVLVVVAVAAAAFAVLR
ncbi:MAG TPA: hypothetical protein VLT33_48385 [Labilithrix sp.]|nr:hypothetical protein [Labilithrix sp.]